MQAKEFRFHSMVEEEYIPVLISGAAVQMTFGLRNYLMVLPVFFGLLRPSVTAILINDCTEAAFDAALAAVPSALAARESLQ